MEFLYCNAQYINYLYHKITNKTVSKLNKLNKFPNVSNVLTFTRAYMSDYRDFTSE